VQDAHAEEGDAEGKVDEVATTEGAKVKAEPQKVPKVVKDSQGSAAKKAAPNAPDSTAEHSKVAAGASTGKNKKQPPPAAVVETKQAEDESSDDDDSSGESSEEEDSEEE
jgi:hypothetical protein